MIYLDVDIVYIDIMFINTYYITYITTKVKLREYIATVLAMSRRL